MASPALMPGVLVLLRLTAFLLRTALLLRLTAFLLRCLRGGGRGLLLLLLGLALAVLLQLLRRQEHLHLLPVGARLHAVGLALRGEVHLRATTTAATAAAAATLAGGAPGCAALLGTPCGGITLVGPVIAFIVTPVIIRLGGRMGAGLSLI
ncbi:hypothetical protein D7V97_42640, partial [Corallococcus sp. CA053C]